MFHNTYTDKNVLVTGHTGFKGSWLTLWLHAMGAKVSGLSLDPEGELNLFEKADISSLLVQDLRGDIQDFSTVTKAVESTSPDIVFHLAAQPIVQDSYRDPLGTLSTNIMGSAHVFEASRQSPCTNALVFVSTDKCYENREREAGYREDEAMGGYDPYSASKGAAELVFASYMRSFFNEEESLLAASGRAGNVIGGGDWADNRIVPDAARALSQNEAVRVRNPDSVRPWQHVLEALSGYLTIGHHLLSGTKEHTGGWNFGPEPSNFKTVRELIDQAVTTWGSGSWKHEAREGDGHEAKLLSLNIEKAKTKLNWHPRWNFEQTVEHTMNWYKNFYDGQDAKSLCLADIAKYEKNPVK